MTEIETRVEEITERIWRKVKGHSDCENMLLTFYIHTRNPFEEHIIEIFIVPEAICLA